MKNGAQDRNIMHWYHASAIVGRALVVRRKSSAVSRWSSAIVRCPSCIVRRRLLVVRIPLSVVRRPSLVICHPSLVVVGRWLSAVVGRHPSSSSVVVGARRGSTWAEWRRGFSRRQAT